MKQAIFFKRVALIATVLALCVVVLGAYVRLSDAGLGCPDWPGCYGTLTVPQSETAIAHAQTVFPDKHIEVHKAWKEMAHRYAAGILGLLILTLFVLAWRAKHSIKVSPYLTTALLLLVVFQAALGMWTVTMLLKPAIVSAHLIGGMSTLAILTWVSHRHWGRVIPNYQIQKNTIYLIRGSIIVIFLQIFLGGWTSTNYAALACNDFPTCHGVWMPDLDFANAFHMVRDLGQGADGKPLTLAALTTIQWIHRIGALITFIYLVTLSLALVKYPQLKNPAKLLVTLLVLQIIIGVSNLLLSLPLVLAVAHNAGAALLLITIVVINSKVTSFNQKGQV